MSNASFIARAGRALVVLALVLAAPLTAIAQPAASQAADNAAKGHFQRGKALAAASKFDEAYRAFEAAYQSSPRPAFLFNMGEAARALGDTARARSAYERFVAAEPSGTLADTARKRLAELGPVPKPAPIAPPPTATKPSSPSVAPPLAKPSSPPVAPPLSKPSSPPVAPPLAKPAAPAITTAPAPAAEPAPKQIPPPHVAVTQTSAATAPEGEYQALPATNESRPFYKKWPFWAIAGGVTAAAIVVVAVSMSSNDPCMAPCIDLSK